MESGVAGYSERLRYVAISRLLLEKHLVALSIGCKRIDHPRRSELQCIPSKSSRS